MKLLEASAAKGRQNEQRILEVLVAAGDEGLTPADVAISSGFAARTSRAAVERLLSRQLATRKGQRGRLFATMAGRSEAGASASGVELLPALEKAIDCFPTQAHRAFLRLLLSGIVARHHLAGFYQDGWGCFIALGGTQTGKTSMAKLPCRVFGWPEVGTVRMLPDETAGSVFARRLQGADGWSIAIPPVLLEAYVCFDEWDKADPDVRKQAGQLLMGYVATELEGQRVEIRPTVMVCLNTGAEGLKVLPQAYVRRAVVLDTGPLEGLLGDIDEAMRKLYRSMQIPRLQLAALRPPANELDDADHAALRTSLREGLTDEGWHLCDVEVLSRLVLGRSALVGDKDLRRAAYATALDYLTTAATLGHTNRGWAAPLVARLGGRGPLVPDAGAVEAELEHRVRAQEQKHCREGMLILEFEAERERRAQLLGDAKAALGRVRDPSTRGVAAALSRAIKNLRRSRGRPRLEEAWSLAKPWLDQAIQIGQAREAAKASALQRRRAEVLSRQTERKAIAAGKQQQAVDRRQARSQWVWWRKQFEGLARGNTPREVLDGLVRFRLLEHLPGALWPPRPERWRSEDGRVWNEHDAANVLRSFHAWADREVVHWGGKSKALTIKLKKDALLAAEDEGRSRLPKRRRGR